MSLPPSPFDPSAPTSSSEPPAPRDRRPALALFTGGAMSGAAAVVLILAFAGVIGPNRSTTTTPSASMPGGVSSGVGGQLVTLPPIVAPTSLTPTTLADGHALGRSDASLVVEVWADYQCPYCARFSAQVEPQIVSAYVATGKVRLVFRNLAFLGEESRWAAVAARLAEQQGKFWPFHDYLFANQQGENAGSFTIERLEEIAGRIGLDRSAFDAGIELSAARSAFAEIRAEMETDASRLGIRSTPTVVVGGKVLEANDWASVKAAIDAALAG